MSFSNDERLALISTVSSTAIPPPSGAIAIMNSDSTDTNAADAHPGTFRQCWSQSLAGIRPVGVALVSRGGSYIAYVADNITPQIRAYRLTLASTSVIFTADTTLDIALPNPALAYDIAKGPPDSATGDVNTLFVTAGTTFNNAVAATPAAPVVNDANTDYLYRIDISTTPATVVAVTDPSLSGPTDIEVSPDGGQLWIANYSGNSVSVFNNANPPTLIQNITGITSPLDIAITPESIRVFIVQHTLNNLAVIRYQDRSVDPRSPAVLAGTSPFGPLSLLKCVDVSSDSRTICITADGSPGAPPIGGGMYTAYNPNDTTTSIIIPVGANPPGSPPAYALFTGPLTEGATVGLSQWDVRFPKKFTPSGSAGSGSGHLCTIGLAQENSSKTRGSFNLIVLVSALAFLLSAYLFVRRYGIGGRN
jgi:DNA-binding beta-propeller fold protein YncE